MSHHSFNNPKYYSCLFLLVLELPLSSDKTEYYNSITLKDQTHLYVRIREFHCCFFKFRSSLLLSSTFESKQNWGVKTKWDPTLSMTFILNSSPFGLQSSHTHPLSSNIEEEYSVSTCLFSGPLWPSETTVKRRQKGYN